MTDVVSIGGTTEHRTDSSQTTYQHKFIMFASLPETEQFIDRLTQDGRYNDAIANVIVGVHNHYKTAEAMQSSLYYPGLDRRIQQLSGLVARDSFRDSSPTRTGNTLILATEIYPTGGHTKVLLDIARSTPSPTIVLTDLFWKFRSDYTQLSWVFDSLGEIPLINLPQNTPLDKCKALIALVERLDPDTIFYLNHHYDPVPFIGTLRHGKSKKLLIHHCDHNPSVGNTLDDVVHVDLIEEVSANCKRHLSNRMASLPLYAVDRGVRSFRPISGGSFSVVSSGNERKFARSGPLALDKIATAVLQATAGNFILVGTFESAWVDEVQVSLNANGIDPSRFCVISPVPSLWDYLKEVDAHFYLGSAPTAGGLAAIEAQGCGFPVIYYGVNNANAMACQSLHASAELGWTDLGQLQALLGSAPAQHRELSRRSRDFYENEHSLTRFTSAIEELIGT